MDVSSEWQVLSLSLRAALVGTLIDIPVALALSWLIVKRRVPGRIVLETLGMLPLALPPVVSGYFLLLLFGGSGLGPSLDRLGLQVTFTWLAVALAAGLVS
ncbi:MAG: molybdate ABC transporter permease subunit, partial [Chloroflexota bacterium]|nr:molybdate ABC transporter permease subunit [Chloroflexota bacterium]